MSITAPDMTDSSSEISGAGVGRRPFSVLLVDENRSQREKISKVLSPDCALIEMADTLSQASALTQRCQFDLCIVSVTRDCQVVLDWLQQLADAGSRSDVVFTTDYADLDTALMALRAGAADLLIRPYRDEQLRNAVRRCLRRQRQQRDNFLLRRRATTHQPSGDLIGQSRAMQDVIQIIERVAPTNSTLLLQGETGTGKELVARAIHTRSGCKGDFVPINCGAIPGELLDSELFGHARGAFTGAHSNREGLFASASNGTLFLDEIGELPLPMQANLLRVLEERRIRPVGGNQELPISCRVIAATNVCLENSVKQGRFRKDLHYRLNVLPITVPPLRERSEDIPELVRHFIQKLGPRLGATSIPLREEDIDQLQAYSWPGNVRELRNLVERALLLGQPLLECCDWNVSQGDAPQSAAASLAFPETMSLSEVNRRHMLAVLESVNGNKSEAARRLCISRKTLERKLQSWREAGLDVSI